MGHCVFANFFLCSLVYFAEDSVSRCHGLPIGSVRLLDRADGVLLCNEVQSLLQRLSLEASTNKLHDREWNLLRVVSDKVEK